MKLGIFDSPLPPWDDIVYGRPLNVSAENVWSPNVPNYIFLRPYILASDLNKAAIGSIGCWLSSSNQVSTYQKSAIFQILVRSLRESREYILDQLELYKKQKHVLVHYKWRR